MLGFIKKRFIGLLSACQTRTTIIDIHYEKTLFLIHMLEYVVQIK